MATGFSAYDCYLAVGETKKGLLLLEENGFKQYHVALAPTFAPQQRLTANNLYEGQPPEVTVTMAAENWTGGAGYTDIPRSESPTSPTVYNYSQGMDVSWGDRAYISPYRNEVLDDTGAVIDGEPLQYLSTSLGTFMITENRIYEWDGSAWTSRDTSGSYRAGAIEFNSYIYVPRTTGNPYLYSSDGVTWTASTRGGTLDEADCFCTRGDDGESTPAYNVIVRLRAGQVSASTDGLNGGAAWSTADQIGPTNETANFITPLDNLVIVWKVEGVYTFDFANVDDFWKALYLKDDNASHVYQWANGLFYSNYGDRLMEFDFTNSTIRQVYPPQDATSPEIKGSITGITGDDNHLFINVQNSAGNTYLVKGKPDSGWHTIAIYLGSQSASASPASAANDASVGTQAWADPTNILLNDGSYATATGGTSQYLAASNFGFAIPGDATIDGIEAVVQHKATVAGADTGVTSAGAGSNYTSIGTNPWTNPGNITSSNNTYATCTTAGATQGIRASEMGFAVPTDSEIVGVTVAVERKAVNGVGPTPATAVYAGTCANDTSIGVSSWGNVTNAQGAPGADAASASLNSSGTNYLKATNFSVSVPGTGNTILGVAIRIKKSATANVGTFIDRSVRLVVGGVIQGDDRASASAWPTGDATTTTYVAYGGATDLWGLSLTEAQVEASDFGVAVAAISSGGSTDAYISGFEVTVYYATASGVVDSVVKLVGLNDAVVGNSKASGSDWPTSDGTASYGGASDVWGAALTPAIVNDDSFGAVVSATIPTSGEAYVDHITIRVYYSRSEVVDSAVKVFKAGVAVGDNKASATEWGTTEEDFTYGAADDLWGTTWTPAEVNASTFGLGVSVSATAGTAGVDVVTLSVYYTTATGTRSSQALYVTGPGYIASENPVILSGYGEGSIYFILPRSNMRPEDDINYRYQTNEPSIIYGPWCDYGGAAYPKFLNRGTELAANTTAGKPITLSYETDDDATGEIVTAVQNGFSAGDISTKVEFNRVRYLTTMETTGSDTSPIGLGWTLQATLNQPRYRVWTLPIFLANSQPLMDRNEDYFQDSAETEDFLFAATRQRPVFTDVRNREFNVRINGLESQGYKKMRIGGEERLGMVYSLQLLEIGPLSTEINDLVYGRDAYGQESDWS